MELWILPFLPFKLTPLSWHGFLYFKNTINPTTNKAAIPIVMIQTQIGRLASFPSSISITSLPAHFLTLRRYLYI